MPLADEEVGTRETALTLIDPKEEEEGEEAHLLPTLRPTAQQYSCTSSCECVNCRRGRAYLHVVVSTLLRPFGVLVVCPSDKTISEPVRSSRNDGSAQENRKSPPLTLVQLVILLLLLLSPLPTAKAFGLGQILQPRNPTLHRPASPALSDPERGVDDEPAEESTVKIRTRDVENPPPPPPLPSGIPLQQVENHMADPWLYNVPIVDPNLQRGVPFTPVYVPNYNYYTAYGTPWGFPETRLVGAYAPPAPPMSQWTPQSQHYSYSYYHHSRNPAPSRRKPSERKRKEKYKGEKCQKICETCLRSYDGAGECEYVSSFKPPKTPLKC